MNKRDLLFYNDYEEFYTMASYSNAFRAFCKEAFGEDFSQDGFSDIEQINRILLYIPKHENVHILDVGCGNGKMLGYLQEKPGRIFMDLIIQSRPSKRRRSCIW